MAVTPTRQTSEQELDQWNQAMRLSPVYLNFMRSKGYATDGRVKLSRDDQTELEAALAAAGTPVPSGMHIDQGGNLNQKNTTKRNVGIALAIGGAAVTGLGAAGIGPLAGAFGSGATAALPTATTIGGYGATAPTVAAVGGGMGLSGKSIVDLIVFGGSTAADIFASKKGAEATDRAAAAQEKAAQDALAFLREQWERERADYAPFLAAETTAANKRNEALSTLARPTRPDSVARVIGPATTAPTMASFGSSAPVAPDLTSVGRGQFTTPGVPAPPALGAPVPQSSTAGMVLMQDPSSGEVRRVHASSVPKYTAKGGRVLQG